MAIQKKDIEVLQKEIELEYQAALKRDDIKSRKLNRQLKFFAIVMIFYMVAIVLAVSVVRGENPFDFFSFNKNRTYVIQENNEQVRKLNDRLNALEKSIKQQSEVTPIEQRLSLIESRQGALSETILKDADTALTAKLLREQQDEIKSDIKDIKEDNQQLNERMDAFISNLLTIPIVGFFLTLFGGLLTWFVSWIKQKHSKDKDQNDKTSLSVISQ